MPQLRLEQMLTKIASFRKTLKPLPLLATVCFLVAFSALDNGVSQHAAIRGYL